MNISHLFYGFYLAGCSCDLYFGSILVLIFLPPHSRLVDFNAATLETLRVDQKLTEAPTLVFEWAPDNNTVIIDEEAPKPVPLRVEIPRIWQIEMILTLDNNVWDQFRVQILVSIF